MIEIVGDILKTLEEQIAYKNLHKKPRIFEDTWNLINSRLIRNINSAMTRAA